MEKVIITVAPTGSVPTRETNSHVPLTPDEIARDVYQCYCAGASVAHIHARSVEGKPTTDPEVFMGIFAKIRSLCDIVIQVSTGVRGGGEEERLAPLGLKPEMASLATGSSNFARSVNYNPPQFVQRLAQIMLDHGIKPELEIFDFSMIDNALYLLDRGLLKPPLHFNLVLNVPGSLKGTPKNLFLLKEHLPSRCTWTVSAIGGSHRQLTALALVLGGHVRVGIEDVIELEKGTPVSNVELVTRVARLAETLGRSIATPAEARAILAL